MGKTFKSIDELIKEIDSEREEYAFMYGVAPVTLAPGQKLVDPSSGKVVAENKVQIQPSTGGSPNREDEPKSKVTGINKEGKDIKVVSGMMNKNPGKDE